MVRCCKIKKIVDDESIINETKKCKIYSNVIKRKKMEESPLSGSKRNCPEIFRHSALILAKYSLFGFPFDPTRDVFKICFIEVNDSQIADQISSITNNLQKDGLISSLQTTYVSQVLCILEISWFDIEFVPLLLERLLTETMIKVTLLSNAKMILHSSMFDAKEMLIVFKNPDYLECRFIQEHRNNYMDIINQEYCLAPWNYKTAMGEAFCSFLNTVNRGFKLRLEDWHHPANYLGWIDFMPLDTIIEELTIGFYPNSSAPVASSSKKICVEGDDLNRVTDEMLDSSSQQQQISYFSESCMICVDKIPNSRVLPCGHAVICDSCAPKIIGLYKQCPICCRSIVKWIAINLQRSPNADTI